MIRRDFLLFLHHLLRIVIGDIENSYGCDAVSEQQLVDVFGGNILDRVDVNVRVDESGSYEHSAGFNYSLRSGFFIAPPAIGRRRRA